MPRTKLCQCEVFMVSLIGASRQHRLESNLQSSTLKQSCSVLNHYEQNVSIVTSSKSLLPNWNLESRTKISPRTPTANKVKTDLMIMYVWTWAGRSFSCSKKYLCERNITDLSEPGNGTHHPSICSFLNSILKCHHKLQIRLSLSLN